MNQLYLPLRGLQKPVPASEFGKGGAPVRPSTMPIDASERKRTPVVSGVLDYFPDAIIAVAQVSHAGNEQHNPGEPLHWARGKSTDQADTVVRHLMERGRIDSDGLRHTAKAAWRILALLQEEIERDIGLLTPAPKETKSAG